VPTWAERFISVLADGRTGQTQSVRANNNAARLK